MRAIPSSIMLACLSLCVAGPALADRTEDREAIEALMWRYARALDTADADGYAAVYAEDGQFGVGATATKGREALRNMIAGLAGGGDSANPRPQLYHMTADTWIEFIDETHARHHSYWMTMRAASGDNPAGVAAVGVGVDDLVRIDGEWLIQVRNINAEQ